jgi:hypothetical protein
MSRRVHVGSLPWHYCHMHMRNVWILAGCQTGDWVVRVATCAQEPVVACTCCLPSPPQARYYYYMIIHDPCMIEVSLCNVQFATSGIRNAGAWNCWDLEHAAINIDSGHCTL